jgi:hypothetical protein
MVDMLIFKREGRKEGREEREARGTVRRFAGCAVAT